MSDASPYLTFGRAAWAALRGGTPMTLTPDDVAELSGINEELSMTEVEEVYLPLSRLVNLHVAAVRELHRVSSRFLGTHAPLVDPQDALGHRPDGVANRRRSVAHGHRPVGDRAHLE